MSARAQPLPAVSIVIPTYNEAEGITSLVENIVGTLRDAGIQGEVIVVDDNSPDGTGQVVDELSKRLPVRALHRSGKLGLSSAVIAGFGQARAPVVGVMDADGSHDPAILPEMVRHIQEGTAELAVGSRYVAGGDTKNWPWTRIFASRVAVFFGHLVCPINDVTSGYFVFRRDIINGVTLSPIGFKILMEVAVKGKYDKYIEVPFTFKDREAGKSKFGLKEVMNFFKQLWTLLPLRSVGYSKKAARRPAQGSRQ